MNRILARLFPAQFDNRFAGHPIALWAFYLLTALTLWRSQHHMVAADGGAQSIATIPLDRFDHGAAGAVIALFALWGLAQLGMALVMLLAALRYKSMIPLLWLFVALEYAGRFLVLHVKPIVTTGTAPGAIGNRLMPFVALAMLILSLRPAKAGD